MFDYVLAMITAHIITVFCQILLFKILILFVELVIFIQKSSLLFYLSYFYFHLKPTGPREQIFCLILYLAYLFPYICLSRLVDSEIELSQRFSNIMKSIRKNVLVPRKYPLF